MAVLVFAFSFFAAPARAATASELQAQIDALLAQVNFLQGQVGTSPSDNQEMLIARSCPTLVGLSRGARGMTVTLLQKSLVELDYLEADNVSGFFGPVTRLALMQFQRENDLSVTGIVDYGTAKLLGTRVSSQYRFYPFCEASTKAPYVESLSPASGRVGTRVFVSGTGSNGGPLFGGAYDVLFGGYNIGRLQEGPSTCTAEGVCTKDLRNFFTVPHELAYHIVCFHSPCPQPAARLVTAGVYGVQLQAADGQKSNTVNFSVADARAAQPPVISEVVPESALPGAEVIIKGRGIQVGDTVYLRSLNYRQCCDIPYDQAATKIIAVDYGSADITVDGYAYFTVPSTMTRLGGIAGGASSPAPIASGAYELSVVTKTFTPTYNSESNAVRFTIPPRQSLPRVSTYLSSQGPIGSRTAYVGGSYEGFGYADVWVRYGRTKQLELGMAGSRHVEGGGAGDFNVQLTGLQPSTLYYYEVQGQEQRSGAPLVRGETREFTTAGEAMPTILRTWQPSPDGWGPAYCNNQIDNRNWLPADHATYRGPKIESCYSQGLQAQNLTGQDCSMYENGLIVKTAVVVGSNYVCTPLGGSTAGLRVTVPNGGEQWQLGSGHTILWTPYDPARNINRAGTQVIAYLEQLVNGSFVTVGRIVESGKASIHWDGDIDSYGNYPQAGSNYYVRLVNSVTGESDRSDRPFTIAPRGTLTARLLLNGSHSAMQNVPSAGMDVTASWVSNASTCNVSVGAIAGAPQDEYQNIEGLLPTGSRTIRVTPRTQTVTLWCRATAPVEGSVNDSIEFIPSQPSTGPASVRVITPNDGTVSSSAAEVNWEMANLSRVSIALYKNDASYVWLSRDVPVSVLGTTGRLAFKPTEVLNANDLTAGSVYKIYILGVKADGTGTVEDKSDNPFAFAAQGTPWIGNFSLGSNTNWAVGTQHTFTWTVRELPSTAKIHVTYFDANSQASASYPTTITELPVTSTAYTWTLPTSLQAGHSYAMRLSVIGTNGTVSGVLADTEGSGQVRALRTFTVPGSTPVCPPPPSVSTINLTRPAAEQQFAQNEPVPVAWNYNWLDQTPPPGVSCPVYSIANPMAHVQIKHTSMGAWETKQANIGALSTTLDFSSNALTGGYDIRVCTTSDTVCSSPRRITINQSAVARIVFTDVIPHVIPEGPVWLICKTRGAANSANIKAYARDASGTYKQFGHAWDSNDGTFYSYRYGGLASVDTTPMTQRWTFGCSEVDSQGRTVVGGTILERAAKCIANSTVDPRTPGTEQVCADHGDLQTLSSSVTAQSRAQSQLANMSSILQGLLRSIGTLTP